MNNQLTNCMQCWIILKYEIKIGLAYNNMMDFTLFEMWYILYRISTIRIRDVSLTTYKNTLRKKV